MDFSFVLGLIILLIIMGVVFVLLWKRIVFNTLASTTQRLEDLDQESLRKLEAANKKLEEAEAEGQNIIQQAKSEAFAIRKEIIDSANAEKEQILKKAKARSEELIEEGENARQALIEEFAKKVEVESIKKASGLLARALPSDIQKQIHSQLSKALLDSGIIPQKNIAMPEEIKEVKVISAFALDDEERNALMNILKGKLATDFSLKAFVDKDLIAGFMIQIGSLILDGSLRHKIQEKARELIGESNE